MARLTDAQIFRIAPETFDEIDDWIRAAQQSGRNVQYGVEAMVMLLARTNQAFAQEMSRGPLDVTGRRGVRYDGRIFSAGTSGPATPIPQYSSTAWKIPVRRITSRYYKGWKVKRLAPGAWMLYNEAREAYFIEYGINWLGGNRRVRRPIRKLSLVKTLRFVDRSRAGERVWEAVFSPFRFRGQAVKRGELLSTEQVQSVPGMRNI